MRVPVGAFLETLAASLPEVLMRRAMVTPVTVSKRSLGNNASSSRLERILARMEPSG
ncbi:MAG TPA: hypothetical protein VN749_14955 [Candidatus Eisenbacteria bacterium]|jgi:hypothetical protein|nr:hypothetical protein [Candidatus Eisenbacteria bacterium]